MDSVRILTNCDATISFSHVLDEDNKRVSDLKYLQLFNKRGGGDYVDVICKVNQDRLILEETDFNPENFAERTEAERRG